MKYFHFEDGGPISGLTIRDYFAAAVLQGLMSLSKDEYDKLADEPVCLAYQYADDMLKMRKPLEIK